jgi:hypothetical protein
MRKAPRRSAEVDAAAGIEALQLLEQRGDVVFRAQVRAQVLLGQRLGGGEQRASVRS